MVLAAFTVTESCRRHPLFPFSIFRVKGLAASDAVQMIALAAFVSVFCFLTLYVQNVAGFSPIRSGSAYLPVTADIVVAAGISSKLFARTGTRPASTAAPRADPRARTDRLTIRTEAGDMKQPGKHVYSPWALVTGKPLTPSPIEQAT